MTASEIEDGLLEDSEKELAPMDRIIQLHKDAVEDLANLQAQLVNLREAVELCEPDRVASERLAGLRLRKDIEAWKAAMVSLVVVRCLFI